MSEFEVIEWIAVGIGAAICLGGVLVIARGGRRTGAGSVVLIVVGALMTIIPSAVIGDAFWESYVSTDTAEDKAIQQLNTATDADGWLSGPGLFMNCALEPTPPSCARVADILFDISQALGSTFIVEDIEIEGADDGSARSEVTFVELENTSGRVADAVLIGVQEHQGWTSSVERGHALWGRTDPMTVELTGPAGERVTAIVTPREPVENTMVFVTLRVVVARS